MRMEGAQKPSRMTRRVFIALSGSAAAATAVAVRSSSAPAQTAPAAAPTKGVELNGKTKAYDVFFCDEGYVPQLAAYLYPLEPLIKRDKLDVQDFVPITMQ